MSDSPPPADSRFPPHPAASPGLGYRSRAGALLPVLLLALCLLCVPGRAALMPAGSNDADYRNYGDQFVAQFRTASLRVTTEPVTHLTATPINSHFAITMAHGVTGVFGNKTYSLVFGSSVHSPTRVIPISRVIIHPAYDGTRNTPDIAILCLAEAEHRIVQVQYGSASYGDTVSSAGYGYGFRIGDPVPTAQDGFVRGWNSWVLDTAPIQSSDLYFNNSIFGSGISFDGKLLSGDSGSPVWNAAGRLIGINGAQSGGLNSTGTNIYLDLSPGTSVLQWLQLNTQIPAPLPELSLALEPGACRVTWDDRAVGWVLQSSPDLAQWTDIGTALTAAGTHSDPIADRPRRFYRLRKP